MHATIVPIGELSRNQDESGMSVSIDPIDLENHVFFLCTQVVFRRDRMLNEALKPLGLLPTEYRTLSAILRKGPLNMHELAQWTAYERTRLTHILHGMEAQGWVERGPSERDKRTVVVHCTPKGGAIFKKAKVVVDKVTTVILSDNSQEEVDLVRAALKTMRRRLIDMEDERR